VTGLCFHLQIRGRFGNGPFGHDLSTKVRKAGNTIINGRGIRGNTLMTNRNHIRCWQISSHAREKNTGLQWQFGTGRLVSLKLGRKKQANLQEGEMEKLDVKNERC